MGYRDTIVFLIPEKYRISCFDPHFGLPGLHHSEQDGLHGL